MTMSAARSVEQIKHQIMVKEVANIIIRQYEAEESMLLEDLELVQPLSKQSIKDVVAYLNKRSLFVSPSYHQGTFRGFVRTP